MQRFANKRVLITGAAGGIGQCIARTFKHGGAIVAVADRNTDVLDADAHFPGDLTDKHYTDRLAQSVHDALSGLDILVNNAGAIARGDVTQMSDAVFALSMAVNVEPPFRLCRAAIPLMASAGGGAIINTASCWGVHPGSNHPVYCMSKAAIASLTQCMGRDHAHQNIRVNAVCPNEEDTPILRSGFSARGFDPDTAISELPNCTSIPEKHKPNDWP